MTTLPQLNDFITLVAYNNLCTLPNFSFSSRLASACPTINNKILTKGLYSSLISYLEDLNTILLANPNTTNYTASQRITYLGNIFFTSRSKVMEYFDAIFYQFLNIFSIDYTNFVQRNTNVLIFASIGLVIGIGLVGLLL